MTKFVYEGRLSDIDTEDQGQAKITQINSDEDSGMFVRVQSWDPTKKHEKFQQVAGKRVRITIEVLE